MISDVLAYQLYDRVIQFSLLREVEKGKFRQISIGKTDMSGGYKPAIEVSVTMLPNSVCLNMTVRVTNMVLAQEVDIRKYLAMSVEMGYPGNTITFTGPVFSSYIEKPNPDGVVVFDGIVTGETGTNIFSSRPYILKFFQKVTMKELVEGICKKISVDDKVIKADFSYCSPDLLNNEIDFQQGEYSATNAYAVINWLQNVLFRWARLQNYVDDAGWTVTGDTKRVVQVVFRNDTIYIIDSHCTPTKQEEKDAIILQAVKSASYSGPALTVIAPYNPRIAPGKVFYMDPIYFKGGASMPNAGITADIYNPDKGLYRVIKEDIKFSTVGNTNEMTLLAVPASMYDGDDSTKIDSTLKSYQDQVQMYHNTEKSDLLSAAGEDQTVVIQWGNKAQPEANEVPPKSMWTADYDPANATPHTPANGQGLESIAALYWTDTQKFYLKDSELNEPFVRNYPDGVSIKYFFPLIMVATDKRMQKDPKTYWIDRNNPNMTKPDKQVMVPSLSVSTAKELIGNTAVAAIFKDVQQYYQGIENNYYAKAFEDIYNYISKGKSS